MKRVRHDRPQRRPMPPSRKPEAMIDLVMVAVGTMFLVGALYAMSHVLMTSRDQLHPEATGGAGEPPTAQPEPVYPEFEHPASEAPVVPESKPPVTTDEPPTPLPQRKPFTPKPGGDVQTSPQGQYQPYQKPGHNPLSPHPEWGLKSQ